MPEFELPFHDRVLVAEPNEDWQQRISDSLEQLGIPYDNTEHPEQVAELMASGEYAGVLSGDLPAADMVATLKAAEESKAGVVVFSNLEYLQYNIELRGGGFFYKARVEDVDDPRLVFSALWGIQRQRQQHDAHTA